MNINEIANLAGVSRATVSRYLNNGYVSQDKKEKIQKVIAQTGYQPSAYAKTLRTKKTQLIGVIIPKINSDSISRMVAGISDVLAEAGYQLLLANTNNDEKEELKYLSVFRQNNIDGIILLGTVITKEHRKAFKELEVPIVILGQQVEGYSCVYYDDFNAARELAEMLLETGKKIGYIGVTQKDEAVGKRRREGFLAALQEKDALDGNEAYTEAEFDMESGCEKAKELLGKHPELDTIFCATDTIAIGAMNCLKEQGKRIPEDVQIAGMGDSRLAMVTTPKLTTVHYFYKSCGMEAAKMLLSQVQGDRVRKEVKMGYEIVVHDSTRQRKSRD